MSWIVTCTCHEGPHNKEENCGCEFCVRRLPRKYELKQIENKISFGKLLSETEQNIILYTLETSVYRENEIKELKQKLECANTTIKDLNGARFFEVAGVYAREAIAKWNEIRACRTSNSDLDLEVIVTNTIEEAIYDLKREFDDYKKSTEKRLALLLSDFGAQQNEVRRLEKILKKANISFSEED